MGGEAVKNIARLSKYFVMVNLKDDETEDDPVTKELLNPPESEYIPKVLFFNPQGEFDPHIKAQTTKWPQYPYYYLKTEQIAETMRYAIQVFSLNTEMEEL